MPGKRGETRRAIYEFIRQQHADGLSPTVREIQAAFGFRAVQSAQEHLDGLIFEGLLTKDPGKSRSYRLAGASNILPMTIPLLGRVHAGPLSEALENIEGTLAVEARGPAELFGLRILGESMIGVGILEGDIVIVRRQAHAEPNDIVVARVGDEATVKRLKRRGDGWVLQPENPAFPAIVVAPPDELQILGKVVEVRRYLDGPP